MVAVQEIGAAPVGHVGAWAARYNYCWFGVPRLRGRKGRGVGFLVHASLRASVALKL
jgi:hypothetical protein